MIWRDLLIEQSVDEPCLVDALADLFTVPSTSVRIVDGFQASSTADTAPRGVLVERWSVRGDAELQLRVFPLDAAAEQIAAVADDLPLLKRLAERLGRSIFTDDGTPDPSAMLRVHPTGRVSRVVLDDELLDGQGQVSLSADNATPTDDRPVGSPPLGVR